MSDIVERLRERALHTEGRSLLEEAADEIERLRHDLANAKMRADIIDSTEAHRRFIENDYQN